MLKSGPRNAARGKEEDVDRATSPSSLDPLRVVIVDDQQTFRQAARSTPSSATSPTPCSSTSASARTTASTSAVR